MIVTTQAIVLNVIKYADNSLIVKCFTKKEGVKSYLLKGVLSSKKGKLKSAYFQPLSQLTIVANHNNKGNLNSIKEVEINVHYKTIFTNIYKQSIAFFISEMLTFSIQEEEENTSLYEYLETSLTWLDTHDKTANFHLCFLLNLTKYLGFYPKLTNLNYDYFDLVGGQFSLQSPKFNFISGDDLVQFKKLLGIHFEALDKIEFSAKNRQQVLAILIQYFELHLNGFRKPKSLEVLKAVFN